VETKTKVKVQSVESGVSIYETTTTNPITYESFEDNITVQKIDGVEGCFYLHNLLSPNECKQFIDLTEDMGYDLAKVTTSFGTMVEAKGVRNNKRVMWQSHEDVWNPIWERVSKYIPATTKLRSRTWKAYGLNERLRFYRYHKGETFLPHYDGSFPRSHDDESMLTFIIYLNDNFEGGNTTFFPRGKPAVSVKPRQGSALIFWHGSHPCSPRHEGSTLQSGEKYVFRSDVMYKVQ